MKVDFEDKTILIFGGSRGIGLSVAKKAYALGANVTVLFKDKNNIEVINKLMPNAKYIIVDLSSETDRAKAVKTIKNRFSKIDYLVNSVGIFKETNIFSIEYNDIKKIMETNVYSSILMIKDIIHLMKAGEGRSMVMISSILAKYSDYNTLAYSLSKSAVDSLTKSLALELAKFSIRVNCVSPSFVDTAMVKEYLSDSTTRKDIINNHPLGRVGQPEDISYAIIFLLSDYSSWITGQNLTIDGGRSITC